MTVILNRADRNLVDRRIRAVRSLVAQSPADRTLAALIPADLALTDLVPARNLERLGRCRHNRVRHFRQTAILPIRIGRRVPPRSSAAAARPARCWGAFPMSPSLRTSRCQATAPAWPSCRRWWAHIRERPSPLVPFPGHGMIQQPAGKDVRRRRWNGSVTGPAWR